MPTKEQEAATLAELVDCLKALSVYQGTFRDLVKPSEAAQAENRRCILRITGMEHHAPVTLHLQVIGGMIRVVEPYVTYNTLIEAPLDVVVRELKAVLDGDETAFSHAWAGGRARIAGTRSVHDGLAFREGFRRLARAVRRYKDSP